MLTITDEMTLLLAKKTFDVAVLSVFALLVFVKFSSLPFALEILTVGVVWAIRADMPNVAASKTGRICVSYVC